MPFKFEPYEQRTAAELRQLGEMGLVKKRLAEIGDRRGIFSHGGGKRQTITIGVCFRTDQSGAAHTYDMDGVRAVNNTEPALPFEVLAIGLPRGASGAATPARVANFADLDGIDLLYIPGSPTAADSQVASTPATTAELRPIHDAELNFNRAVAPVVVAPLGPKPSAKAQTAHLQATATYNKQKRIHDEHTSRAKYELKLIGFARDRGIPVLAICAGSWRLLESYGGKVRTLAIEPRKLHKAENPRDTWTVNHGVHVHGGSMTAQSRNGHCRDLSAINTTHWAVACTRYYNSKLEAVNLKVADPDQLLEIAAMADDPIQATVEAFESRQGAPVVGIQWHPETYLPGMPGAGTGSPEGRKHAAELFRFMAYAAWTSKRRPGQVAMLSQAENLAFDKLKLAAKAASVSNLHRTDELLAEAGLLLRRDAWSPRMLMALEAIEAVVESITIAKKNPAGAGSLYIGARAQLRDIGVAI